MVKEEYLQEIIQPPNVPIVSVSQICPLQGTPSPIQNQDIFLEVLLRVPPCEVLLVHQYSSSRQW